jgi:ribosomal protein S18 acetylase RimI-like enzyme
MVLHVNVVNTEAIQMYKKRGFHFVAEVPDYYGIKKNALIMVKALKTENPTFHGTYSQSK